MCRVAGIISKSLSPLDTLSYVTAMCAVQKHGGPDDEGVFQNEKFNVTIGHRRLSIIDVTDGGHQPMTYDNDRFVISYSGELYNYKLLRLELMQLNYRFKTESDTEVILASFKHWGTGAFQKFSGMFALSIWDNINEELILARDVTGIKPLYFTSNQQLFAYASEVRAFKKIPGFTQSNRNWRVYLMAYGHLPEPFTTLEDVYALPKGTFLRYKTNSHKTELFTFARLTYIESIVNKEYAITQIQESLEKAVKDHLISDAPLGVFLSGGLDSSVIALLANKHQAFLNTISIYFNNKQYSEKKYQDILVKRLSSDHHEFQLSANDFHTFLPSIIQAMDLPCCDGINTWFISKYARESGIKSVLSGIGGDELFGGYPSFKRIGTAELLKYIPKGILRTSRFSASKRFRRLCYLSIENNIGKYLFLRGQFIPSDIASFLNMDEAEVWKILEDQPQQLDISHLSRGNQASWLETNMYMQNQLLRDADVMGMSHGVEIRVPFLDKDFVKLILKVSSGIKYNGKHNKQLLIDSFKDILPREIWNRPKMGFTFPFKEWLSDDIYSNDENGYNISFYHKKFKENGLHWSQFFSIFLLSQYGA